MLFKRVPFNPQRVPPDPQAGCFYPQWVPKKHPRRCKFGPRGCFLVPLRCFEGLSVPNFGPAGCPGDPLRCFGGLEGCIYGPSGPNFGTRGPRFDTQIYF